LYKQSFFYEQLAFEIGGMPFLRQINPSIDTTLIYRSKLTGNSIATFVGLDNPGVFHAVLDANNNRDFSDEKWYKFEIENFSHDYVQSDEDVLCKFEYFDGLNLRDTSLRMELTFTKFRPGYHTEIDSNNDGRMKDKFQLSLKRLSYKFNMAIYQGQQYQFFVSDDYYNLYQYSRDYTLKVRKMPVAINDNLYTYYPSSGELVRLNNSLFRIPMTVADTLSFKYVGETKESDASICKPITPGLAIDLLTNRNYSLGGKTEPPNASACTEILVRNQFLSQLLVASITNNPITVIEIDWPPECNSIVKSSSSSICYC